MKRLYINRKKWLHGEGSGRSFLLRPDDGKMCCLGFLAISCGAKPSDIALGSSPSTAREVSWPKGFLEEIGAPRNTLTTTSLINVNDDVDAYWGNAAREKEIKRLFRQVGIVVIFTGKY